MKTTKQTILFSILILQFAMANVINVPDDYSTIQAGVDAASNGDTVLVQPGTYEENINYNGKNIVVGSLFLTTSNTSFISVTVIDGNQNGSVVTFNSGENTSAVLTGFTIQNGLASNKGGGIYCNNSSPSLENVTISGNSATGYYYGYGGGIYCNNSSPSLENVTISGNSATGFDYGYGGGIYCQYSSPSLENVSISGNSAYSYGGGIYCNNSSPSLENVAISGNSASTEGGGIYCYDSSPSLVNVTISGNSAYSYGGGIFCDWYSNPSLVNCILWNDSPQEIYIFDGSGVNATYSDIQGGWAGTGNINADPLFVDPANGDYHLSWTNYPVQDSTMSPCIDAGDPNSPYDPDSTIADMGVFYFDQSLSISDENISMLPEEFALYQNYPNPFNPVTTIRYKLPEQTHVTIVIYNMLGRTLRQLVNNTQEAGYKSVVWNSKDDSGKPVSAGIYLYQIRADGYTQSRKMLLLK